MMSISRRAAVAQIAALGFMPSVSSAATGMVNASGGALKAKDVDDHVRKAMIKHAVPGVSMALVNHGRIVHLQQFGVKDVETRKPIDVGTVFEAASLSKPVFSQLVMTELQNGRLSLTKPLADILKLDGLDDPRAAKITAKMVLTHTTGLPNWRRENADRKLNLAFDPGTGFRYSGEGYEYLARVLQKLNGGDIRDLERLFQRRIAQATGLKRSRFVMTPAYASLRAQPHQDGKKIDFEINTPGQFGAAYALHTTAQDYATWLISVMKDKGPLSHDTRKLWLSPQNVPIPADHPERALGLSDWALGFQVYELPFGRLHMHGGNNQGFTCLAGARFDAGWGVAVFTNADQASGFLYDVIPMLLGISLG